MAEEESPGGNQPHLADADGPLDSPERVRLSGMGTVTDLDQVFASFRMPHREGRRLFSEFIGTFFLVLAAAGGPMVAFAVPGSVHQIGAVVAPGLMVMVVIMAFGKVSGAHLNPCVSLAFALRGDFPWRRVPGYMVAQLAGAVAAALLLQVIVGVSASHGSTFPANGFTPWTAALLEMVLTFGLVTVILGTASGAQNIGVIGAIGVGAYIALAGIWAAPISGASMNPARTLGPNLAALSFDDSWVYVAGPLAGMVLAVGAAHLLRGPGGGWVGSLAAQGDLAVREGA